MQNTPQRLAATAVLVLLALVLLVGLTTLGRPARQPASAATGSVSPRLPAAWQGEPVTRNANGYAAVASAIAGRTVSVRCIAPEKIASGLPDGSLGLVQFFGSTPGDVAYLDPSVCDELAILAPLTTGDRLCLAGPRAASCATGAAAAALDILTHEAFHLAGVRNEAATECFALQTVAFAARAFGLDRIDAEALAHSAAASREPALGDNYRSASCRSGGPLDLGAGIPSA